MIIYDNISEKDLKLFMKIYAQKIIYGQTNRPKHGSEPPKILLLKAYNKNEPSVDCNNCLF